MSGLSFRRIFPKGLYARSVLLSIVPIVVVLVLMTAYYLNGHMRTINTKLSQGLARQVSLIQEHCRKNPEDPFVSVTVAIRLNMTYECNFLPSDNEPSIKARFFYADLVREQMDFILDGETELYLINGTRLDIRAPAGDGMVRVLVDRKRAMDINGHIFIVWVGFISLLMVITALAFLRNHVRSILRLTEAAQAFGRGQDMDDYNPSGAREIRAAAHAVIEMRQRLTGFAEQRTMMLAGVSHDLRTPLARLQLQLAMQEQDDDVAAARNDIRDMEAMLDEYLAFARGEDGEQTERVNLVGLISEVIGKFPKARVIGGAPDAVWAEIRPIAIKRVISNLLTNATTYGDNAEVQIVADEHCIDIIVDDNGPGIPEEDYEAAFRPFARLNEARTQNQPGVGLGLALARDAAQGHGGTVKLHPSPLGGLRVKMSLPV